MHSTAGSSSDCAITRLWLPSAKILKICGDINALYYFRINFSKKKNLFQEEKNIRKCKFITIVDTSKGAGVRFRDDDLVEINERLVDDSTVNRVNLS